MSDSLRPSGSNTMLIINAKHHEDPESRLLAGMEAVGSCIRCGDTGTLILVHIDDGFPEEVREEAKAGILPSALRRSLEEGSYQPLLDTLSTDKLPLITRRELTGSIIIQFAARKDEDGLFAIASCPACHYDDRVKSGTILLKIAAEQSRFSLLFELATNADVPYEVRNPAGTMMVSLAVEEGNYPILLRFASQHLGVDMLVETEGKIEMAASCAIAKAFERKDQMLLKNIGDDPRLPDPTRALALKKHEELHGILSRKEDDLGRELIGRLAQTAGLPVHKTDLRPPRKR
ncbi:MAG: hypothetical protein U0R44_07025 [Candidatus Micrarchaeia archaeon]